MVEPPPLSIVTGAGSGVMATSERQADLFDPSTFQLKTFRFRLLGGVRSGS